MTLDNNVICDSCGMRTKPPRNGGWVAFMVTAVDGLQFSDCMGHVCDECKIDLRRWLEAQRKAFENKRQGKPS